MGDQKLSAELFVITVLLITGHGGRPFPFTIKVFGIDSTKIKLTFAPRQWGVCALRHGIQISVESILASFPYLRETASEKSKYIARSEINTYRTSYNRAMTLSFSLRVTDWQVVHAAFPFFLVRHLYTRASRPQHLSSVFFCSVRTDR